MSTRPPKGIISLVEAKERLNGLVNIVGVVTDFLEPAPSRGTDFVSTFTLKDASWYEAGLGFRVRYFRKELAQLPPIQSNDDVILLLNLKIYNQRGEVIGMSNHATKWFLFPKTNIDRYLANPKSTLKYEQSLEGQDTRPQEELVHIVKLYRENVLHETPEQDEKPDHVPIAVSAAPRNPLKDDKTLANTRVQPNNTVGTKMVPAMAPARRQKFSLVENLVSEEETGQRLFADLCGEVRRTFEEYERFSLYITDYSSNKRLFNYKNEHEDEEDESNRDGDPYGYAVKKTTKWSGPWGRRTILVECFDGQAQFAKTKIKVGNYVYLSNVYIKMGRNGAYLEGKLRDDPRFPQKALIRKLDARDKEPEVQNLLRRKLEYVKQNQKLYAKFAASQNESTEAANQATIESIESKKRPLSDDVQEPTEKPKKPKNHKQRNREKKAKKQAEAKQAETLLKQSKSTVNENVRCKQVPGATHIPLAKILDNPCLSFQTARGNSITLPFQNVCYRTKLRVIDFFPPSLVNFSAPYTETEFDHLSTHSGSDLDENSDNDNDSILNLGLEHFQGETRWEWRFCLLVEDPSASTVPKPQTLLYVDAQAGDYLLNEEACDLRRDPMKLAKIREKLFHLWGDLEEAKTEAQEKQPNAGAREPTVGVEQQNTGPRSHGQVQAKGGMPFECLIQEYGIPQRKTADRHATASSADYERLFQLWGVSINA